MAGTDDLFADGFENVQLIDTSVDALSVAENGDGSFGVRLTLPPPAPVVVMVMSDDPDAASATPSSVSFDANDYMTYKPVAIHGVDDVDVANESATLLLSGASARDELVTVDVVDDDATLSVSVTGPGSVASNPAGITCGANCTGTFTIGTTVGLMATPDAGFRLDAWGGECAGNEACAVLVDGPKTVTALFVPQIPEHHNCIGVGCTATNPGEELGQTYLDATPLGTYTFNLATAAANAWPVAGTVASGACAGGNSGVLKMTAASCTVWIYAGPLTGRVRYGATCLCPTSGSATWD